MRYGTIVLVAATALGLGRAGRGQEMESREFLSKLQEQFYTNEGSAISGLRVQVTDSSVSMFPGVGAAIVTAQFYWKRDQGLEIGLEGLPAQAGDLTPDIGSYLERRWLDHILVRPLTREFEGFRLAVVRRGERILVEATAVGLREDGVVRQSAQFDTRFRPIERTRFLEGGGTIRERYDTTHVAGKILITRIVQEYEDLAGTDGTLGRFQASLAFEYGRVGSYSLPTRITSAGMGRVHSVTFQEYEIHEGIDDSVDSK